jgi:hypothetical protein
MTSSMRTSLAGSALPLIVFATMNTAGCNERKVSPAPPTPEPPAIVPGLSSLLPDAEPTERHAQADDALVIFPAERAREFHTPQADDYWTPSTENVRAAANAIATHLNTHAALDHLDSSDEWFDAAADNGLGQHLQDGARFILPQLATYRAQFAGVVRHGNRMVAANYLCRWIHPEPGMASYWLSRRWHEVDDGGPCFFHFFYDPRDGSIHDLALKDRRPHPPSIARFAQRTLDFHSPRSSKTSDSGH